MSPSALLSALAFECKHAVRRREHDAHTPGGEGRALEASTFYELAATPNDMSVTGDPLLLLVLCNGVRVAAAHGRDGDFHGCYTDEQRHVEHEPVL